MRFQNLVELCKINGTQDEASGGPCVVCVRAGFKRVPVVDEPAPVLEPPAGCLHRVMIDPFAVNVPCAGYGVYPAVEAARRDKCLYRETARSYSIAVANSGSRRVGAETVIGYRLAAEPRQLCGIVADNDPVQGIVFPVVLKGIGLAGIGFEIVGLAFPFYADVYHKAKRSGCIL